MPRVRAKGRVITRNEVPITINDRSAGRLIIDSSTATGLIVLKALAPEPG